MFHRLSCRWGSSPLARGTRSGFRDVTAGTGLIPARAGNTSREAKRHPGTGAHPRSRGEHMASIGKLSIRVGSSPLARGTRSPSRSLKSPNRLIPARAGNTFLICWRRSRLGAHPRSRGEHRNGTIASQQLRGSSPLARGTLIGLAVSRGSCGLIPARAGNTSICVRARQGTGAHPRSRGEHRVIVSASSLEEGSSPLARGTQKKYLA